MTGGGVGALIEELHEKAVGVEFAASESVTEKEKGPGALGAALLVMLTAAPVVPLRLIHDGPENFQVYGGSPPPALRGMESVSGRLSADAGQVPVISSGGSWTFKEQLRVAAGVFALSESVTVNE